MSEPNLELILSSDPLEAMKKFKITVLLVDDQQIIAEAVKRMVVDEEDIDFHYCSDPTQAITIANEVQPTVILQDLVMPDIDGLTLVKYFRANEATKEVPLIVLSTKEEAKIKAEAFALGANDYMVKLPDRLEVIARIRYHSTGYIRLLERNEAFKRLDESQKILQIELNQAADYVKSLLPPTLDDEIKTTWQFVPSTQLGGDSFGYHWIDDDNFALYLLDVCGHGVGAALLSISAMNVLRSQTLPNTDFYSPTSVLAGLNETFPMEKQNNMFFTMWYGVYRKSDRRLQYSSGGHPPAILMTGETVDKMEIKELITPGLVIGGMPGIEFEMGECTVGPANKLYLYSDGVYEIDKPNGEMVQLPEFIGELTKPTPKGKDDVERMLEYARELNGEGPLEDDFSMVRFIFE